MSGTINYGALFGTTANASSSLLAIYYGLSSSTGSTVRTDPIAALRLAEKNRDRDVATTAKTPEVQRDILAFRKALAKVSTPAEAVAQPAILKVLLTANGLADQLQYTALAKKVLLSDPNDSVSLVNKLGNARWTALAKTFDFANKGLEVLNSAAVQTTLADGFAEVSWRKSLEQSTPGLSDALDFRKRAASVGSAIEILGDSVLRRVVTTALGVPQEIAYQELPAQERAITTRLDLAKLKDSHFVDAFSQRYLLARQNSQTTTATSDLNTLAVQARGLVV